MLRFAPDRRWTPSGKSLALGSAAVLALCVLALIHAAGCRRQELDVTELRSANSEADLAPVRAAAAKLPDAVNLAHAIRYALNHNLDAAVVSQEELIKLEARTGAKRRMLPSLMLSSEESERSVVDASKSNTLFQTRKSSNPSYSEGKRKSTVNLNLAWNLLDFGIAYFRSRQATDEAQIAALRLRRTRQNLILQVTEAYWRAQVSQEALRMSEGLLAKTKRQRAVIQKQVRAGQENKIKGLKIETTLIETQVRLRRHEHTHQANLAKLGALMGLPTGVHLRLAKEDFSPVPPAPPKNLVRLEEEALRQRAELFEQDYQEKIAVDEARIALASMFPNASLFARWDRDAEDLLYQHNWYTVGLNTSLDLLSIPQKRSRRRSAKLQADLACKRRTALAIAIIAQVRLAGIDYADAMEDYTIVDALTGKRAELLTELRKEQDAGGAELNQEAKAEQVESQEVLDAEGQLFSTRLRRLEAVARLHTAAERLRNSSGFDSQAAMAQAILEPRLADGSGVAGMSRGIGSGSKKSTPETRANERLQRWDLAVAERRESALAMPWPFHARRRVAAPPLHRPTGPNEVTVKGSELERWDEAVQERGTAALTKPWLVNKESQRIWSRRARVAKPAADEIPRAPTAEPPAPLARTVPEPGLEMAKVTESTAEPERPALPSAEAHSAGTSMARRRQTELPRQPLPRTAPAPRKNLPVPSLRSAELPAAPDAPVEPVVTAPRRDLAPVPEAPVHLGKIPAGSSDPSRPTLPLRRLGEDREEKAGEEAADLPRHDLERPPASGSKPKSVPRLRSTDLPDAPQLPARPEVGARVEHPAPVPEKPVHLSRTPAATATSRRAGVPVSPPSERGDPALELANEARTLPRQTLPRESSVTRAKTAAEPGQRQVALPNPPPVPARTEARPRRPVPVMPGPAVRITKTAPLATERSAASLNSGARLRPYAARPKAKPASARAPAPVERPAPRPMPGPSLERRPVAVPARRPVPSPEPVRTPETAEEAGLVAPGEFILQKREQPRAVARPAPKGAPQSEPRPVPRRRPTDGVPPLRPDEFPIETPRPGITIDLSYAGR